MAGSTHGCGMSEAQALGLGSVPARPARRLRQNRAAVVAAAVIAVLALLAIVGPWLSPYSYDALDWQHLAVPPGITASHWLGTDPLGRDLYVRTLYGLRLSLLIGVLASAVSVGIGVAWGAIAGYVGGRADSWMMRTVDVLYALPYLFVVIILATVFERGRVAMLLVAIGAVGWSQWRASCAGRRCSSGVNSSRRRRATGLGTTAILLRHIVPVPRRHGGGLCDSHRAGADHVREFLSFLGLGVQEPLASLGSLINEGARQMLPTAPWMLPVPSRRSSSRCFSVSTCWAMVCEMRSIPPRTEEEGAGGGVLRISELSVTFDTPGGEVAAVREVSLTVGRGECVGVVGESGAGKTQLFLATRPAAGDRPSDRQCLARPRAADRPPAVGASRPHPRCAGRPRFPGPDDFAHAAPARR